MINAKIVRHVGITIFWLTLITLFVMPTLAQATVPVSVQILRVKTTDAIDVFDGADFYPIVSIAGSTFGGEEQAFGDDDDIEPAWTFTSNVTTGSTITINIQIWDSDGGLNFGDDHVDISPDGSRDLSLTLDTSTCNITGSIGGQCWITIESSGTSSDKATIWFKVGVGDEPQSANLIVTIERVHQLGENGIGFSEAADFYAVVTIAGREFEGPEWSDDDDISPNWEFSESVPLSVGTTGVSIAIYDRDGGLRGDDDHNVLTTGHGYDVDMNVNLLDCFAGIGTAITGDSSGACATTIHSVGEDDGDHDYSEIFFRIEVEFPPSADNFRIRCLHDNLWPDSGASVTIEAEVVDDAMTPIAVPAGITIEFWVDSTAGPVASSSNVNTATHTFTPPGGATEFTYGCRATDGTQIVWTGWRAVHIGSVGSSKVVPVVYTGTPTSRIDIIFFPDNVDFNSGTYDQFVNAVEEALWLDLYMVDGYVENSHMFNFWLGRDFGRSQDSGGDCDPTAPFDFTYLFADGLGIVHSRSHGDCAYTQNGTFSIEADPATPGADDAFVGSHETGHASFGLADEYNNGNTFYFQPDPHPNLFESVSDCNADAPSLGNSSCRQIKHQTKDEYWYVNDPSGNDLMEDSGTHNANPADRRRIEWIFNLCKSAKC